MNDSEINIIWIGSGIGVMFAVVFVLFILFANYRMRKMSEAVKRIETIVKEGIDSLIHHLKNE